MRKTINGVRYDTKSATKIARAVSPDANPGDFRYWDDELYVTQRSGRYFIFGEGGPMSRWSQAVGQNEWSGGEGILPVTREQALQWCEENDVDEAIIEHYFGDMIEDA